jgi:hypothetical protein
VLLDFGDAIKTLPVHLAPISGSHPHEPPGLVENPIRIEEGKGPATSLDQVVYNLISKAILNAEERKQELNTKEKLEFKSMLSIVFCPASIIIYF